MLRIIFKIAKFVDNDPPGQAPLTRGRSVFKKKKKEERKEENSLIPPKTSSKTFS